MSQAALQCVGAELEQTADPVAQLAERSRESAEALRLAETAGAFGLFGLRVDLADESLWADPADHGYRDSAGPDAPPANDATPAFAFPDLPKRGVHIDPAAPMRLIQAIDWVVILAAAEFAARWGAGVGLAGLTVVGAAAFLASALALKAGLWVTESYRVSPARMRAERGVGGLALGAILGLGVCTAFAPDARAAAALATTLPIAAILLAGIHAALAVWIRAAHRAGAFSETIVLVGATDAAARMAKRAAKSGEARVVAVVDDRLSRVPSRIGAAPVGGNLGDLLQWEGLPNVDRIVITVTQKAEGRVRDIIKRLRVCPNRVDLLLDYDTLNVKGRRFDRLTGTAVACVSGRPCNHRRAFVKRVQDLVISAGLLTLFALPMLAIAAAIRIDSKGPALYRQRRHGFNNRVISILKFRTMRHQPDATVTQVVADDPRITRLGVFLRRTSLDELPQLINVLHGDMSLVGPRPHAIGMKAAERELTQIVAEYAHRHAVKPGITGWAQINGSRGPVHTTAAVRRRVKLDLEYVSRASLWLDLQILLRSAPILFGDTKATR
jgi:exopolysaccharide biosynthesis polyprenyl glycosylphosphotransferase